MEHVDHIPTANENEKVEVFSDDWSMRRFMDRTGFKVIRYGYAYIDDRYYVVKA